MLRKLFASDGAPSGGAVADPPATTQTPPASGGSSFEFSKDLYDGLAALEEPKKPEVKPDEKEESETGDKPLKPEGQKPDEIVQKPDDKPEDKVAADKSADGKPKKAKELKVVYEEAKARIAQLEPELAETKKRLEQIEKAGPATEIKTITAQLEASENRRKELERELEFHSFQKSERFDKEFQKPYLNAFKEALEEVSDFTVQTEGQEPRPGNQNDLVEICRLPGTEALKRAQELFGDAAASVIMNHRREIRRLAKAQESALADAKKNAESRIETEKAEQAKANTRFQEVWQQSYSKLSQQYPAWVNAVEGDDEGNNLLAEGYRQVDRFFQDPKLTPEEKIAIHAEIRMRAANHDRMALRLKRERAERKKIQAELDQYRQSTPPSGGHGTTRVPTQTKTLAEELREEAKKWEAAA